MLLMRRRAGSPCRIPAAIDSVHRGADSNHLILGIQSPNHANPLPTAANDATFLRRRPSSLGSIDPNKGGNNASLILLVGGTYQRPPAPYLA